MSNSSGGQVSSVKLSWLNRLRPQGQAPDYAAQQDNAGEESLSNDDDDAAGSEHSSGSEHSQASLYSVGQPHTPEGTPPVSEDEEEDMADYESRDVADKADALNKAISQLKGYVFDQNDLDFYFNQIEIKMDSAGAGRQFTKLQALSTILPQHVTSQLKPLLRKKQSEFPENNAYLLVKREIFRIFGPPPDAAVNRALTRVLTDKPSTLARDLVGDLCDKQMEGCCCSKTVYTLWKRQLPSSCKAAVANRVFNHTTFNAVLQEADAVFDSTRPAQGVVAAVSEVPTSPSAHETGFHQYWVGQDSTKGANAAVDAIYYQRGRGVVRGRGQRSRGQRGGRGNRGSASGSSGTTSSGGGAGANSGTHPRHKTPRHADLPPFESCKRHWTHGKSAHFCTEPWTCPWKQFFTPPSNNQ